METAHPGSTKHIPSHERHMVTGPLLDHIRKFDMQIIPPNEGELFLSARNPLLSGFKAFELACLEGNAGIYFENHHRSIFLMAHLYNAAVQTDCSRIRWPEMDHLIEIRMGMLFAGALPVEEKQ